MPYPVWALLATPYFRLELPGWGKLLKLLGGLDNPRWKDAPQRVIRGKLHGYKMRLNLSNWSERQVYFLGRYYELDTQLLVQAALLPGETLIDVGGNIGMITLLGASTVGEKGRVHVFEPNPQPAARIRQALDDNAIKQVTLHQMALSDAPGKLTLSVITEHTGMGTLAQVEAEHLNLVSARHEVEVGAGDDVLPSDLIGPAMIKMDVEGFECRAIRGLMRTIRRLKPIICTEVVSHHLQRAGHTADELFEILETEGYRGYGLGARRCGLRQRLSLRAVKPSATMDQNVAWVHPDSVHAQRMQPLMEN